MDVNRFVKNVIIQNYDEIVQYCSSGRRESRDFILKLLNQAILSIDPYRIMSEKISIDSEKEKISIENTQINVKDRKIWIIGAGKAVGRMAEALEFILSGIDYQGIICVPEGTKNGLKIEKIQCLESTHPLPSLKNYQNTKLMIDLTKKIQSEDLVLALISGGGSAILTAPIPPISVDDLIILNSELINSGMPIQEMNVIRKHVSQIKGGKFSRYIQGEIHTCVVSDVIGDSLESIASGPFYPDSSTFSDAKSLLEQFDLWNSSIPASIRQIIEKGIRKLIPETPKGTEEIFKRIYNHILCSNELACRIIVAETKKHGLNSLFLTDKLEGDARWLGTLLARIYSSFTTQIDDPFIVISGGEPTVKVSGKGIGGRNQEVVGSLLSEFLSLNSTPDILFLSAGTDGIDGNSPYCGALIDDLSWSIYHQKKLNISKYQTDNNLSEFFEKIGGSLIELGPTGTNVMDLQIALINASKL
ncbi:MAG: glycerate kinase type-2 family protein [Candidatus Hodarchaeales archaeon]|jgi:glycerate-2-kinase